MELLETNDMKSELLKKSAKHREQIEGEVKLISERTEKALTNALIIGGSLAATYFLVRALAGGSSKSKKSKRKVKIIKAAAAPERIVEAQVVAEPAAPGIVSQIGTVLASQAVTLLLGIAKEKLADYLREKTEEKTESKA
jgi:hypothetical protein